MEKKLDSMTKRLNEFESSINIKIKQNEDNLNSLNRNIIIISTSE